MIFYLAVDEEGRRQLRGTQADARDVNREFQQHDIPTDKAGLMSYVQNLLNELDQGVNQTVILPAQSDAPSEIESVETPVSYTERSVEIDEVFINLPVAHQLTLAAIALENARCLC